MDIVSVVKAHPIPIIGGVVVVLILVSMRGSSSSSPASVSSGAGAGVALESQRIATAANVQIAGINAQASAARGAQQVDLFKSQLSENGKDALARTALMGSMFSTQIQASTALDLDQNKNQTTRMLASMNSQDNKQQMANVLALGQAQINAGVKTTTDRLAADITINNNNNDAKLNGLARTVQGSQDLARIDMELKKYGIDSNYNLESKRATNSHDLAVFQTQTTAANLPSLLQHSENNARIAASNAQSIATINSTTAQILAANNNKAAQTVADGKKNESDVKTAGGWLDIASTIFSFFA